MRQPEAAGDGERAALMASAAACGVDLDDLQAAKLLAFLDLLERWNRSYNLTSLRERSAMRVQHLNDCLAVVPALRRHLASGGRLLDIGSGGGLPAVVLAVVLPDIDVTAIDAVGKKAAFVRQAAGALGLPNLHAVHGRIEAHEAVPYDVITARAFASLAELVRLSARLLAPTGSWMAMKGQRPDDEIAALPAPIDVFHVEPLNVPDLHAQRCLVWMRPRAAAHTGSSTAR